MPEKTYFQLAQEEIAKIAMDSPSNDCEMIFCKLHDKAYLGSEGEDDEDDPHNCLACTLNGGIQRINHFLMMYETHKDEDMFTIYILLLYLEVEKLHTIFKFIGITMEYVEQNWSVLIEIRKWANFIKHPKGFLFTHHPEYVFENETYNKSNDEQIIDFSFVSKFYYHENEDKFKQTIKELGNKGNIIVILPNPQRLAKEFVLVCIAFCEKLKNNPHFQEVLKKHTTISDYNSYAII